LAQPGVFVSRTTKYSTETELASIFRVLTVCHWRWRQHAPPRRQ